MIKNVIFDLGRVLIDWNPKEYLKKRIEDEEKIKAIFREVFASKEWLEIDRGTISFEEAMKLFQDKLPSCKAEIEDIFDNIIELIPPIEKNVEIFKEVASKYNTYILSNFGDKSFDMIYEKYPWFKLFDGHIVSSKVKQIKPERDIYETLINKYNLNTYETIFIDDTLVNIKASEKLGIKGVHYTGEECLRDMLTKLINLD